MILSFVAFAAGTAVTLAARVGTQAPPTFVLNCTLYPDVCDNHCNAKYCHHIIDTNSYFHYDPKSASDQPNPKTKQTAAQLRRQAIGCGGTNYCPKGTDCDEVPYASTYDGGLGCIVARYKGTDRIAQSGTTRCADPQQNSQHGGALTAFYAAKKLGDGDRFQVAVDTVSKLCLALSTRGDAACPDESTGPYRYRSTPATQSFCPTRNPKIFESEASRPNENTKTSKRATTDSGREIHLLFGPQFEMGASVWILGSNGTGIEEKIVSVVDEE